MSASKDSQYTDYDRQQQEAEQNGADAARGQNAEQKELPTLMSVGFEAVLLLGVFLLRIVGCTVLGVVAIGLITNMLSCGGSPAGPWTDVVYDGRPEPSTTMVSMQATIGVLLGGVGGFLYALRNLLNAEIEGVEGLGLFVIWFMSCTALVYSGYWVIGVLLFLALPLAGIIVCRNV